MTEAIDVSRLRDPVYVAQCMQRGEIAMLTRPQMDLLYEGLVAEHVAHARASMQQTFAGGMAVMEQSRSAMRWYLVANVACVLAHALLFLIP